MFLWICFLPLLCSSIRGNTPLLEGGIFEEISCRMYIETLEKGEVRCDGTLPQEDLFWHIIVSAVKSLGINKKNAPETAMRGLGGGSFSTEPLVSMWLGNADGHAEADMVLGARLCQVLQVIWCLLYIGALLMINRHN